MISASDGLSSMRRMRNSGRIDRFDLRGGGGLGRGPGEREEERGAATDLAFDPDPPAVGLHAALADRQARAGPLVVFPGMEATENLEDFRVKLGVDPDAVVAD